TGNGILVVNAINGGTTIPGAFMLTGEVRGGAFDYDLFRGGLGGRAPNDGFLRSSFVVPPGPEPGPGPPSPEIPLDPPPATLPPGVWPIIGPGLATSSCSRSRDSSALRRWARCKSVSVTR